MALRPQCSSRASRRAFLAERMALRRYEAAGSLHPAKNIYEEGNGLHGGNEQAVLSRFTPACIVPPVRPAVNRWPSGPAEKQPCVFHAALIIPGREWGNRYIYPRLATDETIPRPQTDFEQLENTRVQLGNAKGVWYNEADKSEVSEARIMNVKTDRMIIRDFTMNDINDMQDILGDAETIGGMKNEIVLAE